jgi:hypothetical protein
MRLVVFGAAVIVVGAAIITITDTVHPLKIPQLLAATILTLAVAVQRLSGIQRWLTAPASKREVHVKALAQRALVAVCMNRTVSTDLLDIRVHVWEVPLWYRRLFPYTLRGYMKRMVKLRIFSRFTKWVFRPTLRRVAAIGLIERPPSGVVFRKGFGLIGVCIANNDQAEFITLDVSSTKYRNALRSSSESEWEAHGPAVTHNIPLSDATKLAHLYGQVIALVVQHRESGEAIGCATISLKNGSHQRSHRVTEDVFKTNLTDLVLSLSHVLA